MGDDGIDRGRTTTAVDHPRDTSKDFGCELYNGGIRDERPNPGQWRWTSRRASGERFPTKCQRNDSM